MSSAKIIHRTLIISSKLVFVIVVIVSVNNFLFNFCFLEVFSSSSYRYTF